jgi:hypothetical protein
MLWFIRSLAAARDARRYYRGREPGPVARLARDFAALDAAALVLARRKINEAELAAQ